MRSLALISSLVIGSAAFGQVPAQDWRFAHPGATLVGGFRIKAVLDSPLVNQLISEATTKDPSSGMMVGLMKGFAEPPKVAAPAPVEQHQVADAAAKPRSHKKSEWRLDY